MKEAVIKEISAEISIDYKYINRVIELLEQDNTIAFIARYRKDFTNGLDEVQIKTIFDRYHYIYKLEERKEAIINSLKEKELLTKELQDAIIATKKMVELENLYKPYASGRKTRAAVAIAKGLKPLAEIILKIPRNINLQQEAKKYIDPQKEVNTIEEALEGAEDIISEVVSNDLVLRDKWAELLYKHAKLVTKLKDQQKDEENKYKLYYAFSKPIAFIQSYQIMAIDRASDKKVISFSFEYKKDFLEQWAINKYTKKVDWEGAKHIENAVKSGLKRLLIPSIENQVYSELLQKAHDKSASIFAFNLEKVLLQKPIKNKVILGWDPAYVSGCKLAVVDQDNKVLEIAVIYPTKPRNAADLEQAKQKLIELINKYKIDLIAVGNGTASWESADFIAKLIKEQKLNIQFIITPEQGASVYSASKKGIEEFPDLSVEQRSAINIARRNIDPLSELIKIDPKSIGVGQYQHDIAPKVLSEKLDYVVQSSVNKVGVDVNTASVELLTHISGFNLRIAKKLREYVEKKPITNRQDLLKVSGINEKVFQQAAGFLRIKESKEFLDKTSIHPEMYANTYKLLKHLNIDFNKDKINIDSSQKNLEKLSKETEIEFFETKLIVESLNNPLRDYRDDFEDPILRNDTKTIDQITKGMKFKGIVRNITEFGAFVEIGLKNDAFLHISKLNAKNIEDVLSINQTIDVEIEDINIEQQKVSLNLLN
ncbi:helix-hairpin-helix domain-containing protein [Mycoplasma procyoni]|nr:helix-hairpin-helix domain-containing protein [Mycoplasma procyoni]